jgi:hypothetical protein
VDIVIQFSEREEAKALPILLRQQGSADALALVERLAAEEADEKG